MVSILWLSSVLYVVSIAIDLPVWADVLCIIGCFSCYWIACAMWEHHIDKIKTLERKVKRLENCAITEIVEESPNHYVVKRRLGPDKED